MATATLQHPVDAQSSFLNKSLTATSIHEHKPENHNIHTVLNFFKPNEDGSPPHPTYVNKPETYERPFETHNVTIQDVTGDEAKYGLDSHGFQFVPHISKEKDFLDDAQIRDQYYKEVDQILKDVTGATRTFVFDHTIRRPTQDPSFSTLNPEGDEKNTSQTPQVPLRGPVKRVHIDQSYTAALSRVPFHLPSEAEALLKGRVQLINLWRPIKIIRRDPLTVASSQSVREDDLIPIGLIYDQRQGETLSVKYHEEQKLFYKHHQSPEEVLLIKCFDNRAGVESAVKYEARAKRVPHSAFEIPGTEGEEGRESIEVRALVFHENDLE